MPVAILDDEGNVDTVLDNAALEAWSEGVNDFTVDTARLARFIECTHGLLSALEALVLDDTEHSPQYMTLFYDAAKDCFDHDKTQLRTYFAWLYLVLFQVPAGPRWGEFVCVYGVDNFCAMVRRRFDELLY
jgi:lysyl-tRNA synthetase class I